MQRMTVLLCSALIVGLAGIRPFDANAQKFGPATGAVTRGLGDPHRSQRFDDAKLRPDSYWDRGVLVVQEGIDSGPFPGVFLYGRDGARVRENKGWFKGATLVRLGGAAASLDGSIIVSGYAQTTEGAIAYFIARTDSAGNLMAVVRTNPFVPFEVCAAADGTVWAFGHEVQKEEAREDYTVLRQYRFEAGLNAEYLPRHTFRSRMSPTAGIFNDATYLRCSQDKVVAYVNRTNEYIEINTTNNLVSRWAIDMSPLGRMKVLGFAVTEAGQVYGELSEFHNGGDPGWTGLYELKLNVAPGRAAWLPVPGTVNHLSYRDGIPRGVFLRLWGADGDRLVISRGGESGLTWVTPLR